MLKIKDALKFVVRHRVLFILVALVIFSSATGLCVAKGSIISEGKCDKEIVYGETISFRASAFISVVYYEYASARSNDWVTEFPKDVGEFKVRASARGAFGSVKSGTITSPTSARIQFFWNMAIRATTRVIELERMLVKVLVMML